jgi:uncharacterized membrane protein
MNRLFGHNFRRRRPLAGLSVCIITVMQIPSHVQEHIETIARHEQEFYAKRSRGERIGDAVAGFAGNFAFVLLHFAIFVVWIFVNTSDTGPIPHFDPLPFALLDTLVALEAILLASFILMRQSGLAKRADERDHLMLQILLLTEREVSAVVNMNRLIAERIGLGSISTDKEIKEMAEPTPIDNVAQIIQENLTSE